MSIKNEIKNEVCWNCGDPAIGKVQYTTGNIVYKLVKGKIKKEEYIVEICSENYFCAGCQDKAESEI